MVIPNRGGRRQGRSCLRFHRSHFRNSSQRLHWYRQDTKFVTPRRPERDAFHLVLAKTRIESVPDKDLFGILRYKTRTGAQPGDLALQSF